MNFYCRACGLDFVATEHEHCPTCRSPRAVIFMGTYVKREVK